MCAFFIFANIVTSGVKRLLLSLMMGVFSRLPSLLEDRLLPLLVSVVDSPQLSWLLALGDEWSDPDVFESSRFR